MITPNYIKCPCKQCLPPKRHEKCHSDCKDYIEYKRILNLETDKIKKEADIARAVNDICVNGANNGTRPEALKRKRDNKNGYR